MSPETPTSSYGMPHGCAKQTRSLPKRVTTSWSMPFSLRRSTQKPVASAGTESMSVLSWLLPRLPIQPGLAVGEGGQQRARVALPVAVVEVVDRDLAVEEDGLLDAPEAEQPDVEVVVLLRPSDAEGQVVGTADRSLVGHRTRLLLCALRTLVRRSALYQCRPELGRFLAAGERLARHAVSSPWRRPRTRPAGASAPARRRSARPSGAARAASRRAARRPARAGRRRRG